MSIFKKIALSGLDSPQRMTITHPVTGLPLIVKLPDGASKEAFLMVLSVDSAVGKAFDAQTMDRRVQMRQRPTSKDFQAETQAKMAKLVSAGGDWLLCTLDGEHIDAPCTEGNARDLFDEAPWILNQAAEFASSLGNFVKN